MSDVDEARYGRMSLLLLNVCPFTLRHVINDYYVKHGSTSLQDFLDKNKHDIYHILNRRCCCRLIQSGVTPLNRSQWDRLFIKNSSSCRKGYTGDCPCQYDAKPGVTSDVMDITLCCLFIKNICSRHAGINMLHIETIRTIRNHIIHAETAQLDVLTYNGYWNQVKTALLDLANYVSPTVHTDTLRFIQDLETRVMNVGELGEIRKGIVDEKRVKVLEKSMSNVEKDVEIARKDNEQVKKSVKETAEKVTQIEGSMANVEKNLEAASKDNEQVKKSVNDTAERVTQIEGSMAHVEKDLEASCKDNEQVKKSVKETAEKVTQIEESMTQTTHELSKLLKSAEHERGVKRRLSQLEETVGVQGQKIIKLRQEKINLQDEEPDVRRLKQRLINVNNDLTKVITLSPLQERGNELPIELLFSQVVIRTDQNYTVKGDKSDIRFGLHKSNQPTVNDQNSDLENKRTFVSDNDSYSDTQRSFREKLFQHRRELVNPYDIFKTDDDLSSNVYMLGDAAHGKTTFCKWLVKKWCNAQQEGELGRDLDTWETALKKFDFVFLLYFRNVNPGRACVVDMICHDVSRSLNDSHAAIRHALSSEKYRSLVIMDGLDEWNPNEDTRKQLTCQGMPNFDELSSKVTSFISMRPWVLSAISKLVQMNDKVIEILGFSKDGMKHVIKNVLQNRYQLKDNTVEFQNVYQRITMHLEDNSLISFMQIPLLAVICVQIWYDGKQVESSMTSFYAEMLDMLIERAYGKHKLEIGKESLIYKELPEILSQHECINKFRSTLVMVGKIAYEGLISYERELVFQKRKLEKEIGERELQFSLDVGLISETESDSLSKKNVSVHFFHKSMQEFLAAFYIVTNKKVSDSLCKHLSSIKIIMELSNVIMFICGMCPALGSVISQHVVSVTVSDTKFCEYRELPYDDYMEDSSDLDWSRTVEELFELQVSWYRDFKSQQTDCSVTFHVSDVCLLTEKKSETYCLAKKLLSDVVDIRSLFFHNECVDENISDFLCNKHNNTRSLVMVSICDLSLRDIYIPLPSIPSLKYLHLHHIKINNTHLEGCFCPSPLTHMPSLVLLQLQCVTLGDEGLDLSGLTSLRELHLSHITLGDRGLDLSHMTSLQVLKLSDTNLGDKGLDLSDVKSLQFLRLDYATIGDRALDLSDMTALCGLHLIGMTLVPSDVTSRLLFRQGMVTLGDRELDQSNMTPLNKLWLDYVTLGERGLELCNMTSLHELKLFVMDLSYRGLDLSNLKSLRVLHLSNLDLGDSGLDLSDLISLQELELNRLNLGDRGLDLSDMISLQELELYKLNLGDRGLDLSTKMAHIKKVRLVSLEMSAALWQKFLLSLLKIQHRINVELSLTNIDDESKTKIRSSPHFNVANSSSDYFNFTRVWPLSHILHE